MTQTLNQSTNPKYHHIREKQKRQTIEKKSPPKVAMDDDSDSETRAANLMYATLKRAWLAESNAPILLTFKSDAVERFSNLIEKRDAEIERREREANDSGDGTEMLLANIGREELNRMKYVLRSYLRTRIEKIQRFPVHVCLQQVRRYAR